MTYIGFSLVTCYFSAGLSGYDVNKFLISNMLFQCRPKRLLRVSSYLVTCYFSASLSGYDV